MLDYITMYQLYYYNCIFYYNIVTYYVSEIMYNIDYVTILIIYYITKPEH